jgi:hypothetical protein
MSTRKAHLFHQLLLGVGHAGREHGLHVHLGLVQPGRLHPRVGKNPGFFVFFWVFWVFLVFFALWVFLGFFWSFWGFFGFYIYLPRRESFDGFTVSIIL